MPLPPNQSRLVNKRFLVVLSHAIEQAALAAAEDGPLIVIGLFQRLPYLEREAAVYRRIARQATATVVAIVADSDAPLPDVATLVRLDEAEPLAREWAVVVLTPRFGAVLVAHDREEIDSGAPTLESGRRFDASWSTRRDDALHEVIRLRQTLAGRLDPRTGAAIDAALDRVREIPAAQGEARTQGTLGLLAGSLQRELDRSRELRAERDALRTSPAGVEEPAQLLDDAEFARWTGVKSTTASGTLPLALIGVRIAYHRGVPEPFGERDQHRGTPLVARALAEPLGPIDHMVRLSENEFLLVLPSRSHDDAVAVAQHLHGVTAGLTERYPFLSVEATFAVTVTRRRPLPVEEIQLALDWATGEQVSIAVLPPE